MPGVHMGAGEEEGAPETVYVPSIGRKRGIVRLDAPDHNSPTGMSGQEV